MSKSEEQISDYEFEKDIGEGNFGKVKLGVNKKTKEQFAIKIMNKEKIQKITKGFIPEIEISKKFNHKNVIKVYSILEDETNFYLIMEYCSKGELFDLICKKNRLSKEESALFFYQLINGVEYIHSQGYAHRDLKPENLLLTKNNILKIIDFGLTHEYNEDISLKTKCGSPSYAAPEILKGYKYDGFKTDIWSCGIVLYAMLSGFLPFEGETNKILFKNIIKCDLDLNHIIDNDIKDLIKNLLNPEPKQRIDIKDIKKNKFYLEGEKLFHRMEDFNYIKDHYKKSLSNNKKNINTQRNNITIESKRIYDKFSNDKLNKLYFNAFSLTNEAKKGNSEKKTLDLRIYQTSKNAEEIISRHSRNQKIKINPYFSILKNSKKLLKINLNGKIQKLLKEKKLEDTKTRNIVPNIKKVNNTDTGDNNSDSKINIKTENNNKINKGNDLVYFQSQLNHIKYGYKTINAKNNRYHLNLITEPYIFRKNEKNKKNNNDRKSYHLYKMTCRGDKFTKSIDIKRKKAIDFVNKDHYNDVLPRLNNIKNRSNK